LDELALDARLVLLRDVAEIPHRLASRIIMNQHPM
jgi:hypothetical protein